MSDSVKALLEDRDEFINLKLKVKLPRKKSQTKPRKETYEAYVKPRPIPVLNNPSNTDPTNVLTTGLANLNLTGVDQSATQQPAPLDYKCGFVYFILCVPRTPSDMPDYTTDPLEYYIKIGITGSSVLQRLSTLQTGCPFELKIRETWVSPDYKEIEKFLHDILQDDHVRGEWFSI